jgi:hypothetical protein
MAELLLHSLSEFGEIVLGVLEAAGARKVVEVGSEYGSMTRLLAAYAAEREGTLTAIDPAPSPEARTLFEESPAAELIERPSLEVLGDLGADAYLVDGDHNYYTVLMESRLIWEATRRAGRPFLAFYHDVGWPWGRRDLYYDPERIPVEHRHPFTWDRGVVPGEPGVVDGGFRGEGGWACALTEGGPKNGVLSAIEDFVPGKEGSLLWAAIPAVFGLGVLFERNAPWSETVQAFLLPYHENPLLARLEQNRLECYLRVIEWQDRHHAKHAA